MMDNVQNCDGYINILCIHSTVSQHFMEPKGSLPYSQELSTYSYPEPGHSSPHHPIAKFGETKCNKKVK
jgi:hypothetical protein